jgi:hypothetical protein
MLSRLLALALRLLLPVPALGGVKQTSMASLAPS